MTNFLTAFVCYQIINAFFSTTNLCYLHDKFFSDTPSDERKLLAKDYIGETYDFQLTEFRGPEIISDNERRKNEEGVYFIASTDHVDIERKLEEGQEPRFPEEEGMYIGVIPAVKKSNQNKVENRYN